PRSPTASSAGRDPVGTSGALGNPSRLQRASTAASRGVSATTASAWPAIVWIPKIALQPGRSATRATHLTWAILQAPAAGQHDVRTRDVGRVVGEQVARAADRVVGLADVAGRDVLDHL